MNEFTTKYLDGSFAMVNRTPGDEDLVRKAQQGSLEAFNTLFDRYLPVVYRRICCVIPVDDVEDVTQEVFISVLRSLKNFRFEARFSTWLRTLINRQVADYYRARKSGFETYSIEVMLNDPEREMMLSEDHSSHRDEMIVVRQAIASLPENYQDVIMLRFVEGLQFDEIAQAQGQTLEATKSLFRRAIAALQKQISGR